MGLKFYSDFFGVRDFGNNFFWGLTKSETQGSRFYNCIMTQKLSGILLNYYYFFELDFFGVTFWAVGLFLGQGLA